MGPGRVASPLRAIHRCPWAEGDPLLQAYHDSEWGVPEHDGRALWEMLMLEGFQAGLSWSIILRKREAFRKAFKNFAPEKVARFGESDVVRLLQNPGIVRSRAKIEATIGGARAYLLMRDAGEDFSASSSGPTRAGSRCRLGGARAHQQARFRSRCRRRRWRSVASSS